jgi:predicted ABC-type ATPase
MSKHVVIVAGANGSGKTTFADQYIKMSGYQYLGADAIAAQLSPQNVDKVKVKAGRYFFNQINQLIAEEQNIVVESTLSGKSFQRLIPRFKKANYIITILFVYLETPEICIQRISERVLKGGHDVPKVDIKRRYYRSKTQFWYTYKNQADYWHIFYNGIDGFIEIVVGKGTQFNVINDALFELFLRDMSKDEK